MSQTITLTKGEMLSINDEASIPIGTRMTVQNVSLHPCKLIESSTEPSEEGENYTLLTSWQYNPSIKEVPDGAQEMWAFCDAANITLSIEIL